jgi:tRNA dimethylallyltransferase
MQCDIVLYMHSGKAIKPRKILIILGPTASGKSTLAVELAQRFNGEVISADSRQVYRGLNLGTGKITPAEMHGIPHHLIDVADPQHRYSVDEWRRSATLAIDDIISRGKLPIICGGTGFYISSITNGATLPQVEPNEELRAELEKKSAEELMKTLTELDAVRAAAIDPNNKRRIIRAIEIADELGHVPPLADSSSDKKSESSESIASAYETLKIGLAPADADLKQRIHDRIISRLDAGMIEEARQLQSPASAATPSLSYERMDQLGLEYRYLAQLLQGQLTREQFIGMLTTKIWQYSRRQKTWFKRDTTIHWLTPTFAHTTTDEADALIRNFLN